MPTAKITEKKYPSGTPYWMVEAFVGGRRIRRYFIDKEEANKEKERIDSSSVEALEIPERILHEAWACHNDLQKHGWTLRRATDYAMEYSIKFQDQLPVKALIEKYLEEQTDSGLAAETIRDLRSRLAKFKRRFGERKPHEIVPDEIREWLHDMTKVEGLGARSRCHYLSKASQFYIWCVANKRCAENPLTVVKRPKVVDDEIRFFEVAQCRRILELAPEFRLYHYMVLGLFPGVRPNELRRLVGENIRLDRRIIILNAAATKKTRRRFVETPVDDTFGDCLFAWLSARQIPERVFPGSQSTFTRCFREFRDALGFKWIQDGLRHTAATYHFAYYADAAKTAALLGERDVRTLLEHYKGLASKAEAEQFYALRPRDCHGDSTAIANGELIGDAPRAE